jgi:hypothetical protein
MDSVVSGFAGVGKIFSYIGLIFGVIVGIILISVGVSSLSRKFIYINGTITTPGIVGIAAVKYTYNGANYISTLYNAPSGISYKLGQTVNILIDPSNPLTAYSQQPSDKLAIGLIAGGCVVIAVGLLNTYMVRKFPGYAAVVGFKDVFGINRRHPAYGLI